MYDLIVVGSGLFGSVLAHEFTSHGKSVLVLEKRNHIGGNIYTSRTADGINVHVYGAHIFRTNDKIIWDYINQFAEFNNFVNCPIANYNGKIYNLPFNMNTFSKMWDICSPEEALERIESTRIRNTNPSNLEEHVLDLVGTDIYEKLIKGYTEKQWGRKCSELPVDIMRRVPIRFTYDNNYYNAKYQGVPVGGYTQIIEKLLDGSTVLLNTDGKEYLEQNDTSGSIIVYTGCIDEFYDYIYGALDYRSLQFETKDFSVPNYQGNAVINYTSSDIPYTRSIEHKHFEFGEQDKTVITWEYPKHWNVGDEPYYPVNDAKNNALYEKYSSIQTSIIFAGRLGKYEYTDMEDTIRNALALSNKLGVS